MSVKEVMTNLANAARDRYSVSDTLTVSEITDLIYSENADVAKLIDRTIDKIDVADGVTTIGENAFRGCSQLTTVTLPSSIESIGDNAFADCEALTQVICGFYEAQVPGYPWGADVDVTSFIFMEMTPLTLTAEEAGSTVKLTTAGSPTTSGLQYRTDKNDDFAPYTIDTVITLTSVGDYVQFNNTETSLSKSLADCVQFVMTGKIAASGNIQSMLNGSTDCVDHCYARLFIGCTSLTQAPDLPATTLADSCYYAMFRGCTSLTQAPDLPATTLALSCYSSMFADCTSLTQAPDLPATTLADSCYFAMFIGCTSLTQAPDLPATTLALSCYGSMFRGCISLTQVPELPATTLVDSCYSQMFYFCSKLTRIYVGFTAWDISETEHWVDGVAPSGTFKCPSALPEEYGIDRIPEGWTVVRKD